MTTARQYLDRIDDTFATIRSNLGATIRQLHEWTGEFPASTIGAAPPSGPASDYDRDDAEAALSKFEADALTPDAARRALVRCYELVDRLVADLGDLGDSCGAECLPSPVERLAPRLAFIQWQVNKLSAIRTHPRSSITRLETVWHRIDELAAICDNHRPAPDAKPVDNCHAHDAAGLTASIDKHHRRTHLCRWCGEFRKMHDVNPPPKLVRLHDRGIHMTASLLLAAGIRPTSSRRGA